MALSRFIIIKAESHKIFPYHPKKRSLASYFPLFKQFSMNDCPSFYDWLKPQTTRNCKHKLSSIKMFLDRQFIFIIKKIPQSCRSMSLYSHYYGIFFMGVTLLNYVCVIGKRIPPTPSLFAVFSSFFSIGGNSSLQSPLSLHRIVTWHSTLNYSSLALYIEYSYDQATASKLAICVNLQYGGRSRK